MNVVEECRLLSRVLEAKRLDPQQVLRRPALHPGRRAETATQEKLPEAVPRAQLVLLRDLSGPHEIAQGFMRRVRHPHRRQIATPVASSQLLRVASVGLHPVARLDRHQRRCHDVAVHAELAQMPVQAIAVGSCLVADAKSARWPQLLHQPPHRILAIGNAPQRPHFTSRLRYRHRDLLRVDIQTQVSAILHRPAPFACSSALRSADRERNLRTRDWSRSSHSD